MAITSSTKPIELSIYVQHYNQIRFYFSLFKHLYKNKTLIIFTDNIPLFLLLKYNKKYKDCYNDIFLIHNKYYQKEPFIERELEEREKTVLKYDIQYYQKDAKSVKKEYLLIIEYISSKLNDNIVGFCWSGNKMHSYAFATAVKNKKGKIFFGEITNYPGSVYLDPEGTNFYSKIRIEFQDKLNFVSKEELNNEEYKNKLKDIKKKQKTIPQAKKNKKNQLYVLLYAIQNYVFRNGNRYKILNILKNKIILTFSFNKFIKTLIKNDEWINVENFDIAKTNKPKYKILVPLQVSTDTQILVFSRYKSPISFIKHIVSLSDSNIIVDFKLHPAEKKGYNKLIVKLLDKLSKKYSNIQLIEKYKLEDYDAVATINSTFGIDALFENVNVITFGDSLYSGFNFTLKFSEELNSIRKAIECFDLEVDKKRFNLFAKVLLDNFYYFNYFHSKDISDNVDLTLFKDSVNKFNLNM